MKLLLITANEFGKYIKNLSRRQNAYASARLGRKMPEIAGDQAIGADGLSDSEKGLVVGVWKLFGPSLGPHTQSSICCRTSSALL